MLLTKLLRPGVKAFGVIPAKAGIQSFQAFLDPGFRRGDYVGNLVFLKLAALDRNSVSD
jgi:hypothetical protein